MGGVSRKILQGVIAILGLCALTGFVMGLTSTMSRKAASSDEEAPIASNVPANVAIKDAQPIAPPPPPAPPKPKAAVADAASDQPPSDAPAKVAAPTETAPNAPPVVAPAPKAAAPAKLPDDLPPT